MSVINEGDTYRVEGTASDQIRADLERISRTLHETQNAHLAVVANDAPDGATSASAYRGEVAFLRTQRVEGPADFVRDTTAIREWINGGGVDASRLEAELRVWATQIGASLDAHERAGEPGPREDPVRPGTADLRSPAPHHATQEGAGDDGPASGGDGALSADGADSHDVGRTEPEPAPSTDPGESTDREDVEGCTSPLERSPGSASVGAQRVASWLWVRHGIEVTAEHVERVAQGVTG